RRHRARDGDRQEGRAPRLRARARHEHPQQPADPGARGPGALVKTEKADQDALLAYLGHEVEAARKEQAAFGETAAKDVESALQWRADGALVAVFTERHAKIALE